LHRCTGLLGALHGLDDPAEAGVPSEPLRLTSNAPRTRPS
jgi:hypothetical protein